MAKMRSSAIAFQISGDHGGIVEVDADLLQFIV
jgi:hypothetical protein